MTCIHCSGKLEASQCTDKNCYLYMMEQTEDERAQLNDYRRQRIVEDAVSAADEILMKQANGTVEELDHLTACMAKEFVGKVHGRVMMVMMRAESEEKVKKARAND